MPNQNRLVFLRTTPCRILLLYCLFIPFPSFSQQIISTYAGNGTGGYTGDGIQATSAELYQPSSLTMDAAGNIYVADYSNNRIRKIDAVTKVITTFAGTGTAGFNGDGGLAVNAAINGPIDICHDAAGNIYFADFQNSRIRKIDAITGVITTVAGNGTTNYVAGSLAINSGILSASGVTVDKNGNIYIPGYLSHVILKVDAVTGIMTTFAGNGTQAYSGDGGPAINAGLSALGSRTDNAGNLFFADNLNNCIRKIDAITGIITTVAGTGGPGFKGDNGLAIEAKLSGPDDVNVDAAGNLLIADAGNNVVRRVDAITGIITLVAGNNTKGYSGDGGYAYCASLSNPSEVISDPFDNVFICDNGNNVIRRVDHNVITTNQPELTISASRYSVCIGDTITLFSQLQNGLGGTPFYSWTRNGQAINLNASTIVAYTASPSDIFECSFNFPNSGCILPVTYSSNKIVVKSAPLTQASVSLVASNTESCSGDNVTFTATPVNGGPNPVFEWQVGRQIITVNGPPVFKIPLTGTSKVKVTMFPDQSTCGRPLQVADSINIIVHPTDTAAIAIGTQDSTVCLGALTIFTAYYSQVGASFQWMINGNPVGTNSPRFIPNILLNGDIVSCILTVDTTVGCIRPSHVLSNFIPITVVPVPAPVVAIQASVNDVCQGTPITFTAELLSGGTDPIYQWQVNGNNTGVTTPTYINNNLVDGDQVNVILTGGHLACPAGKGVSSDILTMTIKPTPQVAVNPSDTSVFAGHSVAIIATVSGNAASFSWQPPSGLSDPNSLTPVAIPFESTTYTLKVIGDNGCETDKTAALKIYRVMNMPNAFTPGKATNNIFRIPPGVGFTLKEFSVFNRWGQRIFSTKDIGRGWDGTFHGANSDVGTYAYIVTGAIQGKDVIFKGTVTLIR